MSTVLFANQVVKYYDRFNRFYRIGGLGACGLAARELGTGGSGACESGVCELAACETE